MKFCQKTYQSVALMKLLGIQTELFSSVFSHLWFQYLIPLQEYCPHVQTFHVQRNIDNGDEAFNVALHIKQLRSKPPRPLTRPLFDIFYAYIRLRLC